MISLGTKPIWAIHGRSLTCPEPQMLPRFEITNAQHILSARVAFEQLNLFKNSPDFFSFFLFFFFSFFICGLSRSNPPLLPLQPFWYDSPVANKSMQVISRATLQGGEKMRGKLRDIHVRILSQLCAKCETTRGNVVAGCTPGRNCGQ